MGSRPGPPLWPQFPHLYNGRPSLNCPYPPSLTTHQRPQHNSHSVLRVLSRPLPLYHTPSLDPPRLLSGPLRVFRADRFNPWQFTSSEPLGPLLQHLPGLPIVCRIMAELLASAFKASLDWPQLTVLPVPAFPACTMCPKLQPPWPPCSSAPWNF